MKYLHFYDLFVKFIKLIAFQGKDLINIYITRKGHKKTY